MLIHILQAGYLLFLLSLDFGWLYRRTDRGNSNDHNRIARVKHVGVHFTVARGRMRSFMTNACPPETERTLNGC